MAITDGLLKAFELLGQKKNMSHIKIADHLMSMAIETEELSHAASRAAGSTEFLLMQEAVADVRGRCAALKEHYALVSTVFAKNNITSIATTEGIIERLARIEAVPGGLLIDINSAFQGTISQEAESAQKRYDLWDAINFLAEEAGHLRTIANAVRAGA